MCKPKKPIPSLLVDNPNGGGRGERDRCGVMNAMIHGNPYSLDQESHGFAGFDDAASLHHFGTFFLAPVTHGVEMLKPEAGGLDFFDSLIDFGGGNLAGNPNDHCLTGRSTTC